ncbi:MAG: secretion ATPase, locus subfamily [Proteobacteria bacterium]|nr:secretion ATPase, locus subfamily [Pseudomonadota bacterium]
MYESFYGLTSKPFQLNPDPGFYFASKQHRRAASYLEYGLHQNEGFIVVTGEVGAGKTTIVRGLLDKLDSSKVVAAQLVSTQLDADDTLRMVAGAFGVKTKGLSKSDVLLALEAFLVSVTQQGKRCLLIVDEAQNLTAQAVEELRMLSNFQFETQALLQSFLIGQPEFRSIMQSPQMQQLRQRVIAACHIGPMDQQETHGYINHRLKCAGFSGTPLFDDDAARQIFAATGGVPRRINLLCDRILLFGFLAGTKVFSLGDVEEVARELNEETQASATPADAGAGGWSSVGSALVDGDRLDVELSKSVLDTASADAATRTITDLSNGISEQRIVRLERSMIRIEHSCAATLMLLQQLVNAMRAPAPERES